MQFRSFVLQINGDVTGHDESDSRRAKSNPIARAWGIRFGLCNLLAALTLVSALGCRRVRPADPRVARTVETINELINGVHAMEPDSEQDYLARLRGALDRLGRAASAEEFACPFIVSAYFFNDTQTPDGRLKFMAVWLQSSGAPSKIVVQDSEGAELASVGLSPLPFDETSVLRGGFAAVRLDGNSADAVVGGEAPGGKNELRITVGSTVDELRQLSAVLITGGGCRSKPIPIFASEQLTFPAEHADAGQRDTPD